MHVNEGVLDADFDRGKVMLQPRAELGLALPLLDRSLFFIVLGFSEQRLDEMLEPGVRFKGPKGMVFGTGGTNS